MSSGSSSIRNPSIREKKTEAIEIIIKMCQVYNRNFIHTFDRQRVLALMVSGGQSPSAGSVRVADLLDDPVVQNIHLYVYFLFIVVR